MLRLQLLVLSPHYLYPRLRHHQVLLYLLPLLRRLRVP
jgi:hypothetical protein